MMRHAFSHCGLELRRWVQATAEGANELAGRYELSSQKKRSGGLLNLGKHMRKATRKASKRMKLFGA
jgi:hypothetical protein